MDPFLLLDTPAFKFSPLFIPGCALWLRADAGLYTDAAMTMPAVNDADVVGGWADQSGQNNNATQVTTAKKPLLKLGIVNGKAVVRLDGVDDRITLGVAVSLGTIFVVANHKGAAFSADGYNGLFSDGVNDDVGILGSGGTTELRAGGQAHTAYVNGVATHEYAPLTAFKIVTWVFDANQSKKWDIGYQGLAVRYWDGDVVEVVAYGTALSAANCGRVETYLGSKYGITLS